MPDLGSTLAGSDLAEDAFLALGTVPWQETSEPTLSTLPIPVVACRSTPASPPPAR